METQGQITVTTDIDAPNRVLVIISTPDGNVGLSMTLKNFEIFLKKSKVVKDIAAAAEESIHGKSNLRGDN